jgi:hypothetical protein
MSVEFSLVDAWYRAVLGNSSSATSKGDNISHSIPPIEITDEMVEAGFRVLYNSGIADEYLEADKSLVVGIFAAMIEAR